VTRLRFNLTFDSFKKKYYVNHSDKISETWINEIVESLQKLCDSTTRRNTIKLE